MALSLVSPIVDLISLGIKVFEMGKPFVLEQYDLLKGCEDALGRLDSLIPPIEIVLAAVDGGQLELAGGLIKVVQNFRAILYEANEVLDGLRYLELQIKVSSPSSNLLGKLKRPSVPILNKLKRVVSKLEEHAKLVELYRSMVRDNQQQQQEAAAARQTNECQTVPLLARRLPIGGLDSETQQIVGWLCESSNDNAATDDDGSNVTIISILGTAGVGKTTLAWHVYNHSGVVESFEPRIWHYVSPSSSYTIGCQEALLNSAEGLQPRRRSLDSLQAAVNEKSDSSQKKFLLALDGLQNALCFEVFATLANGGTRGSTILLTTQQLPLVRALAVKLGEGVKIKSKTLRGLSFEDSFSLLKQYAFYGVDPDDYKQLHGIGKEIAHRLRHSPKAVELVALHLYNTLTTDYWKDFLDTSLSNLKDTKEIVMSPLHLIYCHLPEHLRPCLVYSSVFPRDHEFRRDDLVHMWMAAGLIKESEHESLVVKGSRYFDELLNYNIFEPSSSSDGYIMHNLFHDLARSMSYGECSSVVGDKFNKDTKDRGMIIRHLFVRTKNITCLESVKKCENLRTLFVLFDGYNPQHAKNFKEMFKALKRIRVLLINVNGMGSLPNEIGELQHLRYLKVFQPIRQLPDSISKLYHLQILNIEKESPFVLPSRMNNLISMRHLMVDSSISEKIAGIGKLVSIQELSFRVKKETGHKIEELTHLTELRELKIKSLESVESSEQACDVKLCEKSRLYELELEWSRNSSQDKQILDCLRPHSNLKKLTIRGYMHSAPPNWITGIEMNNLEYVEFEGCLELKCLPSFGELPLLKYLHLKNMPAVNKIDCKGGFPQLRVLHICGFDTWKVWSDPEAVSANFCDRMHELRIEDCPMLKELPSLPFGLEELSLKNVGLTAFPTLKNQRTASSSSCPFPLSSLIISGCEALISFGNLREALPHISSTEISGCSTLCKAVSSWIREGLHVPEGGLKIRLKG